MLFSNGDKRDPQHSGNFRQCGECEVMSTAKPTRYGGGRRANTLGKFLLGHAISLQRIINLISNMERPFHLLPYLLRGSCQRLAEMLCSRYILSHKSYSLSSTPIISVFSIRTSPFLILVKQPSAAMSSSAVPTYLTLLFIMFIISARRSRNSLC